jgi:hypothetical protein
MLRKCLLSLATMAALALAVASVAAADPPTRTFLPAGPFSGSFCPGFDVLLTPIINQEYGLSFSDGGMIISGRLVDQLTNLSTGTSIDINASGPARLSDDGTTLTLLGETLIPSEGGFFYPGSPPDIQLISGLVVVDFSTGTVTETGHIRDLCNELA